MIPSIKLGFIGSYKADLLHFFSKILLTMNKEVAIIDASREQYLLTTIPETINNEITYQGVDCFINYINIEQLIGFKYEQYAITLVDYGFNERLIEDFNSCTLLFVVTDFERHHILALKHLILHGLKQSSKVVMVYRDIVKCKITPQYINYLLDIENCAKVLAQYQFELNPNDYENKLLCQYNDVLNSKKISKGYKQMFGDIMEELLGLSHKEAVRVIKATEEGKKWR